jgi:EAL domain-containing protein (putative c-di-GMP-specific phosphodiesterase class I)
LVEGAFVSVRGRLVVRNAVAAARSAGAHVIAEGVAEDAWVSTLREIGFDSLRGYAFGRAQSLDGFPLVDRRFIS